MSVEALFDIRQGQRQVVARKIESWQRDPAAANTVQDLEDLIAACLAEEETDERFFREMLDRSHLLSPEGLGRLNRLIQHCCGEALYTLNELGQRVRQAEADGFHLKHAARIETAAATYRRWKEDVPELLLVHHGPIKDQLRERIMAAIHSPAPESNWQELFEENGR